MANIRNTSAMNPTMRTAANWAAALLTVSLLAGCHNHPPVEHGEKFAPDDAPTAIGRMSQAQSASGAKADGMLYPRNFHGVALNSLGQTKLDLILKGTSAGDPVVAYLNMPHDDVTARQLAVTAYLKDAGVDESRITLVEGPNTGNTSVAAANLSHVYKGKDGSYNGEYAEDADAGAAGGGAAGGK